MNIFIAGISYNLSNADLGELFEEFGEVISAKIVMDRETGRSKGFGFVEMPNDEEGNAAIAALNEKEIDGKTLAVSVARPREEGVVTAITVVVIVAAMVTTVVVVTVVVIVAAAMAAVVTDINRTRLPVCQNRLIEEMPGICSGHLFFMIFVATPFPCI